MKPAIIYSLRDPRDGSMRYIGKSTDIRGRLFAHIKDARRGSDDYKARWIRLLESNGERPVVSQLFAVPCEMKWQHAERFFIASARYLGLALTNCTSGGDGASDLTVESLRRRSAAVKVSWTCPMDRANRIAGLRRALGTQAQRDSKSIISAHRFKDPKYRAKHLASVLAVHGDPEKRAALTAAARAWYDDPANRERRVEQMRHMVNRADVRAKIIATNATPEGRERQRAAAMRPEVRAKKAAAMRKYFDDPVWLAKRTAALRASKQRSSAKNEMLVAA